ncbi:hypothetical protein EX30DRAFT_61047 [Ascodesmis nigricans]|uniref:Inheritance of peroxisomes protein 1 n=1 Tax=Ascodesmis nigricans TaxID=341454 RepID=A0A4S2MUB2_9PEZI|nr:hypothetical protein EX30DRAFT_61047 [Ascodesmis nigricans]
MERRLSSSSAASSAPSFSSPRRCFTSPPSSVTSLGSNRGGSGAISEKEKDDKIEILFSHPVAKVVGFTVSAKMMERPELSWRGPEERTIASGPLRIYRTLPQEVAFLQSGSALRPLLKRTQCWNVDGNRIFCLQLRPGSYWRIEILGPEEEQPVQIEAFKETLSAVAAYEVTTCPFIRAPECEPLVEHPELMAPARVWSRSHLRRVSDTASVPPIAGFSFLHAPNNSEVVCDTRSVKSGGDERPRRNSELQDERDCRSDYSSGSTSGPSLVSQRVKLLEACNELEEPVNLSTGRTWIKPLFPGEDEGSIESAEEKGKMKQMLAEEVATRARDRVLRRSSTARTCAGHGPPLPRTPERNSEAPTRRFDPINNWLEYTPPMSPPSTIRHNPSHPILLEEPTSSPPTSPTPTLHTRRNPSTPINPLTLSPISSQFSPSTPSLSPTSTTSLDLPPSFIIPPTSPILRNTAASLGLTKKAHQLASSASYIVFRPKTYLVSTMVSIATQIAETGVIGAAFRTTEQGELKWMWSMDRVEALGWNFG